MNITIEELSNLIRPNNTLENKDYGRCCVQLIGRLVFIANMKSEDGFLHLTNVKNIRYWAERKHGLGTLIVDGFIEDDKIDDWPDTVSPAHQLIAVTPISFDDN